LYSPCYFCYLEIEYETNETNKVCHCSDAPRLHIALLFTAFQSENCFNED
jgi:hypothetical protein